MVDCTCLIWIVLFTHVLLVVANRQLVYNQAKAIYSGSTREKYRYHGSWREAMRYYRISSIGEAPIGCNVVVVDSQHVN